MKTKAKMRWLVAALVLWATPVLASSAIRLTLEELVSRADRVVVAELTRSRSYWGPKHMRIYSEYTFTVVDDLAGSGPREFSIVQPGGTVGRLTQVTHGFPSFSPAEQVTLFLRRRAEQVWVVGMCQGVFVRILDQDRPYAVQKLEGLHFPDDSGRPLLFEQAAFARKVKSLWAARSRP